jgi:hypothetical protein
MMSQWFKFGILLFFIMGCRSSWAQNTDIETLKTQILELARSYEGKADPDQALQKNLDLLVSELLAKSQMPPVKDRLPLIAGAWKQVWGPYDYSNDEGGIDPTLGIFEIYQVVSAQGFYYNVAPLYPGGNKTREQIGLLRGEFTLNPVEPNVLDVRFTDYPGVDPRPSDLNLWELAALAEVGQLPNAIVVVPSPLVKQFFKGGSLEEVYTDYDLRLLYGRKLPPSTRKFLYVMTRMN